MSFAAQDQNYLVEPALVLRKTEYSESSVIIATLTAHFGQVHFLVKGNRYSTQHTFTGIDLFQLLNISFKAKWSADLQTARHVDLVRSHHAIGDNYQRCCLAAWASRFILPNTQPNNPAPALFQALDCALARWSQASRQSGVPELIGVLFVALREFGCLAQFDDRDDYHQREIERLRDFSLRLDVSPPDYTPAEWQKLGLWLKDYISQYTNLTLPSGLFELLAGEEKVS